MKLTASAVPTHAKKHALSLEETMRVDLVAERVAFALKDIFIMMMANASESKNVKVFQVYYINAYDLTIII